MTEQACVDKGEELLKAYSYNIFNATIYFFLGGEIEKARDALIASLEKEAFRTRDIDREEALSVLTHEVRDHVVRCMYKLKAENYVFYDLTYGDGEDTFEKLLVEDGLQFHIAEKIVKFLFHTREILFTAVICLTND